LETVLALIAIFQIQASERMEPEVDAFVRVRLDELKLSDLDLLTFLIEFYQVA